MRVVLDANVVAGAVCWLGESWLCFVALARRRATAFGTLDTLRESREVTLRIIKERQPKHNAAARLTWYLDQVRLVEPAPLGKQRSRDKSDDPYLAAALASKAAAIVTYDGDLLDLGKPFGIPVMKPAQFLKMI